MVRRDDVRCPPLAGGTNGDCSAGECMTLAAMETPALIQPMNASGPRLSNVFLRGVGTALPEWSWSGSHTFECMAELWHLRGASLDRWRRIVEGTNINTRHSVLPMEQVIDCSTAQRMALFERHAPPLACAAAQRALLHAGVSPGQVTELIIVTCTGFSAPGLDVEVVTRLNLSPAVRRTTVGFMGCFGGISGLRTAVGACAATPGAVSLVVCCELCSLHVRRASDVQNQVATALFADGAAAAVIESSADDGNSSDYGNRSINTGRHGRLTVGHSRLLSHGRDWMTWRITDAGFAMTLAREVPAALRETLAEFVAGAPDRVRPASFIVHPGGPGILDAAEAALDLRGGRGLEHSRAVLARIGNISSATVLFVLEESLRHRAPLPAMLLAFGPGLTVESLLLIP